jgi:sugar phosphate isomerase/epimerase
MTRALSLAYLTISELSPPEAVLAARQAGYDSVDLRLLPIAPGDRSYDLSTRSPMIRETLDRMANTGIQIYDVEQIRLTRDLDLEPLQSFFESVSRLGARRVKVAGIDPDPSVVADRMAAVCERLQPLGITADIEFMMWSSVQTVVEAARIVHAAGAENAGILVDALHLSRSGGSPKDLAGIPASRFGYMHLCDAPATPPASIPQMLEEARMMRELPGDGELPLVPLLQALPPDLTVSVEIGMRHRSFDPQTRANLGLEAARRVIAQADEGL